MSGPHRVQLRRTKGWRMPENTVKVDRTTKWGNPFVIGKAYPVAHDDCLSDTGLTVVIQDARDAVNAFRDWLECVGWVHDIDPAELRGRNLACWCPLDRPCHADALLALANAPEDGKP